MTVAESNRRRTGEKRSLESCQRIKEGLRRKYSSPEYLRQRYDYVIANAALNEHGCLIWWKAVDKDGYPKVRGKASHIILRLKTGEEANSRMALHTCCTPSCVNPDHLYWGTAHDNAVDRVRDGHQNRPPVLCGESNPAYGKGPPARSKMGRSRAMKNYWSTLNADERTERAKQGWETRRKETVRSGG